MSKYLIEQLRENASVRGKQKTWVSDLTDDQLWELFQRFRRDESAKSIARYIQTAWKVLPESSTHSVSQGILKFRRRISHLLLSPPSESSASVLQDFNEVDSLEALEQIAKQFQDRITGMLKEEEETGIKFSHLNRDLQALASLQKVIMKQKEWELLHDDPIKLRKIAQREKRMQERFDAWMGTMTDDDRERLIKGMDLFLEKIGEHAVTAVIDSEGSYHLVEPEESHEKSGSK